MTYLPSVSSTNNPTIVEDHDEAFDDYLQIEKSRDQSRIYPCLSNLTVKTESLPEHDYSSVSSISSLHNNESLNSNKSSFIKIPSPIHKYNELSKSEDRFVMKIIRSPSTSPLPSTSTTDQYSTSDESMGNKFLRNKVTAALNNMKYRWAVKMRPNFRTNQSPIYCLGKIYNDLEKTTLYDDAVKFNTHQDFLKHVSNRIYFSYRKSFKPLVGAKTGDAITSDGGWGCMLRCAQMLLAQTIFMQWTTTNQIYQSDRLRINHFQASNAIYQRRSNVSRLLSSQKETYTRIIRLFGDFPDLQCPFGIHKLVELGIGHGIRAGEFFGPASAAHCLKEAMDIAVEKKAYSDTLSIYVSPDAIIYRQDVYNLFDQKSSANHETVDCSSNVHSVLILIPLRLGLNELDLVYEEYLKEALKLSQTVGIIGGSPRHAVYIIGFQDDSFIDLDPHLLQNTVNVLEPNFDLESFSCSTPKTLTARKMDPSCTLGFYCRDKADFEMFCAQWNRICHLAPDSRRDCPMFRIEAGTFEENQKKLFNGQYSSLNEDESLILRVTKIPHSNESLSLTDRLQSMRTSLMNSNSNLKANRNSWDDSDRSLNSNQYSHQRTISDDYVFL